MVSKSTPTTNLQNSIENCYFDVGNVILTYFNELLEYETEFSATHRCLE